MPPSYLQAFFCLCVIGTFTSIIEGRYANNGNYLPIPAERGSRCNQNCQCPANYQPFCASDANTRTQTTYSNKCQLECARGCNPGLRVEFEGVCAVAYNKNGESKIHHHQKENYNKPPPRRPKPTRPPLPPPAYQERNCLRGCVCGYNFSPTCGSNGEIYGNECLFNCAQRNCDRYLRIEPLEKCEDFSRATLPTIPPVQIPTRRYSYGKQ